MWIEPALGPLRLRKKMYGNSMIKNPSLGYPTGRKPSLDLHEQNNYSSDCPCCLSSYGFTVLWFRFLLLDTRFSGDYLYFSHFGTSSVSFPFHFDCKSGGTIDLIISLWVEPQVLVSEPKLTGTLTAQNCRYHKTKVSVLSVFSVLDQH